MNGYAPNPSSDSSAGAASLTAGLLARKGEALPAVDADAHAGIDIAMRPMRPAQGPVSGVSEDTIETLYAPNPGGAKPASTGSNIRTFRARPANGNLRRTAPDNWTIMPPAAKARMPRKSRPAVNPDDDKGRKATITFRMPARDFIRMRMASRDLEMSCQSILLDALDTYLDANDVEPIDKETVMRETERLARVLRRKHSRTR